MYDGSSNPYDHMLHFNQAIILNAWNNWLLCKVFPASLKGPALAWFHKFPRESLNSFNKLWAVFVSQYLQIVRKEKSACSNPSSSGTTSPSRTSPGDLGKSSNKLILTIWTKSYRTSEEVLGRLLLSSSPFPLIHLQPWKNCIDGQTNIPLWRIIFGPPHK